jgi:predicted nucleotidyltransferase
MTTKTKKTFGTEERKQQKAVLEKYRKAKQIPTFGDIARDADVSVSTVTYFMDGNSRNESIRNVLRKHIKETMNKVPDDLSKLIKIWDLDKE